jgi:hypothetical protein
LTGKILSSSNAARKSNPVRIMVTANTNEPKATNQEALVKPANETTGGTRPVIPHAVVIRSATT